MAAGVTGKGDSLETMLFQYATKGELESTSKHLETLIETKTNGLSTQIEGIGASVRMMASEFRATQEPQYGNWIQAGSLIALVAGGMWVLMNSQLTGLRETYALGNQAIRSEIDHVKNGTNRYSSEDAERETDRDIEKTRHQEILNIEWQRLQDESIIKGKVADARQDEWQRLMEFEINQRGLWMSKEQEKVNRLDEKARYHIELDDPTRVQPEDVLRELQRGNRVEVEP